MYRSFYGLKERPFDLTANPRYLYLTVKHSEALSMLRYAVLTRRGLSLLIGEAGTGKTTLVRAALSDTDVRPGSVVYVSNPTLTRAEFLECLAAGFGLDDHVGQSKTRLLQALEHHLLNRRQRGEMAALIVDEAQSLTDELLEEIRLLSNIETATDKLLSVVLAGQPPLAERLNDVTLRQLKQRIALRCVLDPLDRAETAAYISRRIGIAGGIAPDLFTREAVEEVYRRSGGVPRTIGVICDNALITGFAHKERPVTLQTVQAVCRDFEFGVDRLPAPARAEGFTPSADLQPSPADDLPHAVAHQRTWNTAAFAPSPAARPWPLLGRLGRLFHS